MDQDDAVPEDAGSSREWLEKITSAEKAFNIYQSKCDRIEEAFGNLEKLSSNTADPKLNIFWANLQVLKPAIYQRPPNPVVMPRHSDLGDVVRKAAEMLERALQFDVENDDLHDTMMAVRDDLALSGRGAPWVLDNGACIHVSRQDFLHEPARKWSEVNWVARAVHVTKKEGRDRFGKSFNAVQTVKIGDQREDDYRETNDKAKVWEIWCKETRRVYYVTEGIDTILEESEPFINVKGFFPCPRPAYSTVQPGTLLPVPDFVYYRDQVDEINIMTRRITALTESLRMKGFYASGTSEVGEAIEAAMRQTSDKAILVPVSSLAALGGGSLKDSIIWLPVAEIGNLIQGLVGLRKQLIEDVYEITGLSDIMRGATKAQETLGAQQLKAQFGSIRVRDRQAEMVRVARDVIRTKAEVLAETYDPMEIMQMAAMQIPTAEQMAAEEQQQAQMQQAAQMRQAQAQMPGQPQHPQQPAPPPKKRQVSIDQIAALFQAQKIRPFLLDVETDSTIAPDEQAEKQSRIEFITAIGGFMEKAQGAIAAAPETAPFLGELMKFTAGGFRAGRDLGGAIDDFVDMVEKRAAKAGQGGHPNPEMMKVQAQLQGDQAKAQGEMQIKQAQVRADAQVQQAKVQTDRERAANEFALAKMKFEAEMQLARDRLNAEMELAREKAAMAVKVGASSGSDTVGSAVRFGGEIG